MTRTNTVPTLSIAILAGGEGSRFGGLDKGWLTLDGAPLIERMLMQLEPQGYPLLINANRNLDAYARHGHPVIRDAVSGFGGPLAGISAVLDHARTEWVLFVPVDATRLPPDFAQRMCAAMHQDGSAVSTSTVVAHDGISIVPVACLIPTHLREDLSAALASGHRSVRDWLLRHHVVEVHFDDHPRTYWSVNTPEELKILERQSKSRNPL